MSQRSIDELIQALRDGDFEARQRAAEQLVTFGEVAIEPLIDVLRSFETYEAYSASDQTANAVHAAENALIEIGAAAVAPLIGALSEKSWGANHGAIYCLGEIGDVRAVQPLVEVLDSDDVTVITDVDEVLLKFGATAVRPLIDALRQNSVSLRRGAAYVLGELRDLLATPALIEALQDADSTVRASAAAALGSIADARAVEPLIAARTDPDPAVREAVVRALGETGLKLNAPQIPMALARSMHDQDWGVRQSAAEMLIRLGSSYIESARWLLLTDLQNNDVEVRLGAAWSLLPAREPKAVDTLLHLLTTTNPHISSSAALALGEYGEKGAIAALLPLLDQADPQVTHAAQTALRKLGYDFGE